MAAFLILLTIVGVIFWASATDTTRSRKGKVEGAKEALRTQRQALVKRGDLPPTFTSYDQYIRSDWWRRLRTHTLNYLSNKCEFCGAPAKNVHHIRYPRFKRLGSENIKSLCAVCTRCHDVAHGFDEKSDEGTCAFCHGPATRTLAISLPKHTKLHQRTCFRCEALANGYRGQANRWTQRRYEEWVAHWRDTIPPLYPTAEKSAVPREDRLEESKQLLRLERQELAADARRPHLIEFQAELSPLSTEELMELWKSREARNYQDDEIVLLRSMVRKRLGHE